VGQPEASRLLVCSLLLGCLPDFGELRSGDGLASGGSNQSSGNAGAGVGGGAGAGAAGAAGGASDTCVLDVAGDTLYGFDTTSLTGSIAGTWSTYPEGSLALGDSTITWSPTEGHACPGALTLSVPFDTYGEQKVMALINFQENWSSPSAFTRLHAWVKIQLPEGGSLEHLRGAQLSISSGPSYDAFRSNFLPVGTFSDGDWHELSVTLEPLDPPPSVGAYIPDSVRQIGAQVITALAAPPGGPPAPLTTTLFVDDIWLERPPALVP
jgi:hypothetical protein